MLRAMRAVTVARGIDPRGHALMAFGGAGPLHATALAEELGIARILCPRECGVLSALGLAAAAPRRDASGSFESAKVASLRERARAALGSEPRRERVRYALRYRGQSFELSVDAPAAANEADLRALFEDAHQQAYGFRDPAGEVELVTVTVSVWGGAPELGPTVLHSPTTVQRTLIRHAGQDLDAALITGAPAPGERLAGPAVVALADATLLITPRWRGLVLADGTIELTRG
jgi:N-methylhydantoinase A